MNNTEFTFDFAAGQITVFAINYEQAKILAQAEAIKRGWDYAIYRGKSYLPRTYAELEYTSEQLESDPIAIEGARFDDMNYRYYTER